MQCFSKVWGQLLKPNSFNTPNKSVYYYDFWRSCDTEDWSYNVENTVLHHRNIFYFKVYYNRKPILYFTILLFLSWWAEEPPLKSITNLTDPKLLCSSVYKHTHTHTHTHCICDTFYENPTKVDFVLWFTVFYIKSFFIR